MNNRFNFCPNCASQNIHNINMRRWQCDDCGFVLYNNVATAVAVIVLNKAGDVLFEVRAKEPKRGMLCLPGGFVEPGETTEQACVRECHEELGVDITNLEYLCTFPNTYEYKGFQYKTCDAFFVAEIADNANFNLQPDEVAAVKWCALKNRQDLLNLPIAFDSARDALNYFYINKH